MWVQIEYLGYYGNFRCLDQAYIGTALSYEINMFDRFWINWVAHNMKQTKLPILKYGVFYLLISFFTYSVRIADKIVGIYIEHFSISVDTLNFVCHCFMEIHYIKTLMKTISTNSNTLFIYIYIHFISSCLPRFSFRWQGNFF